MFSEWGRRGERREGAGMDAAQRVQSGDGNDGAAGDDGVRGRDWGLCRIEFPDQRRELHGSVGAGWGEHGVV